MDDKRLATWIAKLSKQKLPAFAHTARSLAYVSRENDSSANDLSNVILRDSAMTARVLRIANSVHYNVSGRPIETVSYATVMLGFEQVRNLALTVSMIDTVLDATSQSQVQKEMVCAYHAAVQSQRLGQCNDSNNLEAIYIGALLHRLGPIMFWCFPFGQGEILHQAYNSQEQPEDTETRILGFDLNSLTSLLVTEWNLSEMLGEVLIDEDEQHHSTSPIGIGLGIANNIDKGWESEEIQGQISNTAAYLNRDVKQAKEFIYESARIATDGLESFGFPQTDLLLSPKVKPSKPVVVEDAASSHELELRILRQLTQMLGENLDLNRLLMAVLEGIYRVLNMDQVVFALIEQGSNALRVKYMIGNQREAIMEKKITNTGNGKFLRQIIAKGEPSWITEKILFQTPAEARNPLIQHLGAQEFFVSPIVINKKAIGVIYCDRSSSNIKLGKDNLQSFGHLCEHAALAFRILSVHR